MAKPTPAAEIDVTNELVRSLLSSQFPEYDALELRLVANGWDNAMYRLGEKLAVRLPRRSLAAPLIINEQKWLPRLGPLLPLPVPVPVGFGKPGNCYPWHWSITRWVEGQAAGPGQVRDDQAIVMASFLQSLHQPAPPSAPRNPVRGVPLAHRDSITGQYLEDLADQIDGSEVRKVWNEALEAPTHGGAPVWLHGDLHPLNVILDNDVIVAVVDFGDITRGDPATELSIAFGLLSESQRCRFRNALNIDAGTWARAKGWALTMGMAYIAYGSDNLVMSAIGHTTIAAVLSAEP